jgi:MiaB-like tRNA modifying enzyme
MNHGEARSAGEILADLGYEVSFGLEASGIEDAEGVLLFTCDVISSTERRMWKLMEEVNRSGKKLYAAGCLASIEAERIRERFPGAVILDTMGLERTEASVRKYFEKSEKKPGINWNNDPSRLDHIVPISSGCLGSCTYCITREARGPLKSNSGSVIADRIRAGLDRGRKEILLSSQDTGSWGIDLGKGQNLGTLLRFLSSSVCEEMRIRVGMMNPDHLSQNLENILSGFADKRIFRFFHLPVQSGSSEVLGRMNRNYSPGDVESVINSLRERYPEATLSTDVIAGFPGESEEDHRKSVEFISKVGPDILNITRFSSRKGTPASEMENQVQGWISKERSREFHRIHEEILKEKLRGRLGIHRNCLVTEVGKEGTMMARDLNYTPIVIEGGKDLLGRFVEIKTERVGPTYLLGKIVNF